MGCNWESAPAVLLLLLQSERGRGKSLPLLTAVSFNLRLRSNCSLRCLSCLRFSRSPSLSLSLFLCLPIVSPNRVLWPTIALKWTQLYERLLGLGLALRRGLCFGLGPKRLPLFPSLLAAWLTAWNNSKYHASQIKLCMCVCCNWWIVGGLRGWRKMGVRCAERLLVATSMLTCKHKPNATTSEHHEE